jgi:hypothetical protein
VNVLRYGIATAFRGLRRGDPPMLVVGSLLTFFSWRKGRKPKRRVATKVKLKAGQAVGLRVTAKRSTPKEFIIR